jgi:alkylhydroperoxidase family enzyme
MSQKFAAIPTTAIDLPLVQRLRRSPRFRVRVPKSLPARIAASSGAGTDENGQLVALDDVRSVAKNAANDENGCGSGIQAHRDHWLQRAYPDRGATA